MPLTVKGREIYSAMLRTYKSKRKARRVFYASANAKVITGVHLARKKRKGKV